MHMQTVPLATFHLLRISHIRNSVRSTFHLLRIFYIRRLTPDGKGGRFNFPGQTYPDRICYRTGCDVRECRVLLPEGVRIGERITCPLGESEWSAPDSDVRSVSSGGVVPTPCTRRRSPLRRSTFFRYFTSGDAGWERRAFQLPLSDISGFSDSAYPKSFAAILHSVAVFS